MQALDHHVATAFVFQANLFNAVLRAFKRGDGRHLNRRKCAVIVIALDASQRVHQMRIADHEADAPAGHVVALAHGEELNGDVFRSLHLHDAWRFIAVETQVRVG